MSGMAGLAENKNGTAGAKLPYDWFCFLFLGLRGIEWANLGAEGARKLCIS
jgi:hypothetical protein